MYPMSWFFGSSALNKALDKLKEPHRSVAKRIARLHHCKTTEDLYGTLRKLYHVKNQDAAAKRHYRAAAAAMQARGLV